MSENKAELKEQLKIQKDHSRRNNVRVDGIEEDDNQTLEDTENKLSSFLYDKLKITEEYIYIEREPTVLEEGKVLMLIVIALLEQLFLS